MPSILSQEMFDNHRAFGDRTRADFYVVGVTGRLLFAVCMKASLPTTLDTESCIDLPPPRVPTVINRPRRLEADVPETADVLQCFAESIILNVQVVTTSAQGFADRIEAPMRSVASPLDAAA